MPKKANARRQLVRGRRGVYYRLTPNGQRIPGVFEIGYTDSDGKRRWQTVLGNVEDAEAERSAKLAKMGRGERVAPARLTLAEFTAGWLDEQEGRLRPKTLVSYEGQLRRHVLPTLGHRRIGEITTDHVAQLVAVMERKGYAAWSISGMLGALSGVLRRAVRRGLIPTNPVSGLQRDERPRTRQKEKRILATREIERLLAHGDAHYRPLLATAIATGLRLGELCGLVWTDIDFDRGFLHVRTQVDQHGRRSAPKTATAVRAVVMSRQLSKLLAEHKLASPWAAASDPVFASGRGKPLRHETVTRAGLQRALERAQLLDPSRPRITMHSLRDTFASQLIVDLGLDVVQVSRQLGHANPAITAKTYARLFDEARHADAIRTAMNNSPFGAALATPSAAAAEDSTRATASLR